MALDLYVIIGISLCVTQPVTIIANLMTIAAFMKVPSLQTHTSNLLIFALSITDLVCGVYQLLYYGIPSAFGLRPPLGEIGCMVSVPLEYTYNTGNFLLIAISIDRVLLVSMDYSQYVKMMTKFRLKALAGICVMICQVASIIELSFWNYAKRNNANAASINFKKLCLFPARRMNSFSIYVSVCYLFLPLIAVGIFSIIFVKRLLIRVRGPQRIAPVTDDNNSNIRSAGENREEIAREETTTKKRYVKSAVTLAALVAAMGVSLLPYCTYRIVNALNGELNSNMEYAVYLALQLNPLLDPLFFAATQKGIREYYATKIRAILRTFTAFRNPN